MQEEKTMPSWVEFDGGSETKNKRAKNWVIVLYPEDCPENWLEELRRLQTALVISPLHDKDKDESGANKKKHHHIILAGQGSWIYYKDLQEVGRILRGVASPQRVSNMAGMVRYLIHADDPQKASYSRKDIQVVGNVDIEKYFKASESENHEMIAEIMDFVDDNDITEFWVLLKYAREERFDSWFRLLCSQAWLLEKYVTSKRHGRG